ncbi:MAG TPA: hypothetical protein GX746_01730 [Bacteroidales bacterium]|nr:hypothetical protein [Bacteroidales bacterium]
MYGTGIYNDGVNTWLILSNDNKKPFVQLESLIVIPETVGQFTGLHDINGKRIFEGDILQVYNYKCVVKFGIHEANNGWYAESDGGIMGELNNSFEIAEIIGTIHDEVTP